MEPASPSPRRVPEHHPASPAGAGIVQGRRRRRPAGEPPPLPRRLGMTGWWWLGLGTIAIIASTRCWPVPFMKSCLGLIAFNQFYPVVADSGAAELLPVDQRVLEVLA